MNYRTQNNNRTRIAGFTSLLMLFIVTSFSHAGPSFTQKNISDVGWAVTYAGSTYDSATDTSTFFYSLTAQATEKNLSHWVLGLCQNLLPTGSGTNTTIGLDPTTGTYGFKWDDGQAAGTTATYYIALRGRYKLATVDYAVKGGTYFAIGQTTAPCEQEVAVSKCSIAGRAFIDANGNGSVDAGEPLLANLSINLADAQGNFLATAMTDASGNYAFSGLLAGTYLVGVPTSTSDVSGDFNETLTAYFSPTTAELRTATICPDSLTNNFGFAINTSALLADLQKSDPDGDGFTFSGTGKTIGFWKHQCNVVVTGKGRAQIDAKTLQGYLDAVEALFLVLPFQLNDANEYADAASILSSTSSSPVELLKKQLLGTELNQVSGLGLTGSLGGISAGQLQLAVIAWAEYLVTNSTSYTSAQLLAAKDICDYINNTGE